MIKTSLAISPAPSDFAPLLFSGEWKLGIMTALELGYDAVELSLKDPNDEEIGRILTELQNHKLELSAIATGQSYYHDGLSLINPDPEDRKILLTRLKRFIELISPWSGFVILGGIRGVFKGNKNAFCEQEDLAIEMIRACSDYARLNNVRILLEPINRYETNFLNTVHDCLRLIEEAQLNNVYILADSFHMNIEEKSMSAALVEAGPKLGYLHFSDSNRKAPGQGHINFLELNQNLKQVSYQGYVCAEILPLPDSFTAARNAINFYRSLN